MNWRAASYLYPANERAALRLRLVEDRTISNSEVFDIAFKLGAPFVVAFEVLGCGFQKLALVLLLDVFGLSCEIFNRGIQLWNLKRNEHMLTATQFSKEVGASYPTIISWLDQGIVPGTVKKSDHRGEYWEIPELALDMERPKRGRKPKPKNGKPSVKKKGISK